jgi:O-antigen/teichoic acid export membrane protein
MSASALRRLIGFTVLPAFSFATPLLLWPAITRQYGAAGFAAFAVGQSAGAAVAVLVELGWGLNGGRLVTAAPTHASRRTYFALSLTSRLCILLLLAPAVASGISLSVDEFGPTAGAAVMAAGVAGLSSNWFFIATGRPGALLISDAMPRLLAALVGAALLWRGAPLVVVPLTQLATSLVSVLIAAQLAGVKPRQFRLLTWDLVWRAVRNQTSALTGRGLSALYIALPTTVVNLVNPSAVPVFAAVERTLRLALTLLASVPSAMQAWVGEGHAVGDLGRRLRLAAYVNVALGVLAGTVFALAGPYAERVLFSGQIAVPSVGYVLAGGALAITCASRTTGSLSLVHLDKLRQLAWSAFAGALIGLPAVAFGAAAYGAVGAVAALLAAELVVLAVQIVSLSRTASLQTEARAQDASSGA